MTSGDLDKAILPPTLGDLPALPAPIPNDAQYLLHRKGQCVKIEHLIFDELLELYKTNRGVAIATSGATYSTVKFSRHIPRAVVLVSIKSTSNQLVSGVVTHVNLDGFRFDFQAPIPSTGITELHWKVFSL